MEVDLSSRCRVCLNDNEEMHYLFDEFDQGIKLSEIFTSTTNFQIEQENGYSPYICEECTTIVVKFYNLKAMYQENETQVKALLSNFEEAPEESQEEIYDSITIKVEDDFESDEDSYKGTQTTTKKHPSEDSYVCAICNVSFFYECDAEKHLFSKHNIKLDQQKEYEEGEDGKIHPNRTCWKCRISFISVEDYRSHSTTHKKIMCEICGLGFTKRTYLKDHQDSHYPEKTHQCEFCQKSFQRRTVLLKHRRLHTHPRECVCEICGRAFNDKSTLKTHINLVHIRDRNYACTICGLKFPMKSTMEKHMRRHDKTDRNFACGQCSLAYKDKSSLERHLLLKHSGKNLAVNCEFCGKQYSNNLNLLKHQKYMHCMVVDIKESSD